MAKYGLTPDGPNIKRLDVILDDMHTNLSERWGVNTRQNPQSFLNHLLTVFADKVAELWEFGEDVYYAGYPTTAEGRNLDNACQYGGVTRESAKKSYYPVHCTGKDGTTLAANTMIATEMNPPTQLTLTESRQISRGAFNKAVIKVASAVSGETYTAAINGAVHNFVSKTAEPIDILVGLAGAIVDKGFTASVDEAAVLLKIEALDLASVNVLVLSSNLTTETVTSVITFGTVETGDILLPDGTITSIVNADAGLLSVVNMCGYIAGRKEETDPEYRKSYADKIFNRSSMMLESIRSAILNNVQGVRSVAPYENATNETDAYGRPAHSIEIVVDGGDSKEIAQQIFKKKAAGISTYGSIEIPLAGAYGEDITIRFNRPITVFTWMRLGITLRKNAAIPANYVELLREAVLENIDALEVGQDVVPQEFLTKLYDACSGISYIDIGIFSTQSSADVPTSYPDRIAEITARQRAFVTAEMIEVAIDG